MTTTTTTPANTDSGFNTLPFIEAYSAATKEVIRPLRLLPNDYLVIREDTKEGWWRAQIRCLKPAQLPSNLKTITGVEVTAANGFCSYDARKWFRKIPEAKPPKSGLEWRIAATDFTALMIHQGWAHDRIVMSPNAEQTYRYLLVRFLAQNSRAQMVARYKLQKEVPNLPKSFKDREGKELSDYQRVALAYCYRSPGAALFMDQGTGKTPIAVARICTEARETQQNEKRMYRALVICPNAVRLNWQHEFGAFATTRGKVSVMRGSKVERVKLAALTVKDEPEDYAFGVCIVGYDTVKNDIEFMGRIKWDLVVLDESHWIKSAVKQTVRTKAALELAESADQRMCLTGTPMANTVLDLYPQLEMLYTGGSGFTNAKAFGQYHAEFAANPHGGDFTQGMKRIPLIRERLARMSFRVTKDEAGLQLPPKVYDIVEVEMTPKQAKIYAQVQQTLAAEIQDGIRTKRLTANHILTKLIRLAQVTSGHVKWDADVDLQTMDIIEEAHVEPILPNPKVTALLSMVEELTEKMIVWAVFREDIRQIGEALTEAGVNHRLYYGATPQPQREKAVREFNEDPSVRVIVLSPHTAAEGLNLLGYDYWNSTPKSESYVERVVYFSADWSFLKRKQSEDRAHRRGTRMPVQITDLVVPHDAQIDSIDQEMRDRVAAKDANAKLVQDVRGVLQRLVGVSLPEGFDKYSV